MTPLRLFRSGGARLGLALAFGMFCSAAACGNLIGLEEWEDPPPATSSSGSSDSQGSASASATTSGGAGGAGGQGGSSASTGASTTTGGGVPDEQDGGSNCNACIATSCGAEMAACDMDPQCSKLIAPCPLDPGPCCEAQGYQPANATSEAAYVCINEKCGLTCPIAGPHCADCIQNTFEETDVDCGGDACKPCKSGRRCKNDTDCVSGKCNPGACEGGMCCL
jgi:hypothetical protein